MLASRSCVVGRSERSISEPTGKSRAQRAFPHSLGQKRKFSCAIQQTDRPHLYASRWWLDGTGVDDGYRRDRRGAPQGSATKKVAQRSYTPRPPRGPGSPIAHRPSPGLTQMGVRTIFVTPDTDELPLLDKNRCSPTLACGPHRTAALLRALHGWAVFFII